MILQPTKYKNTFRTIQGTGNPNLVFNNDVILLCDTQSAPVVINLLELTPDYWNTVYKLYIEDHTGNASTNNITIVAPAGYTINGQASLVINVDNATCIIRIANNTSYIATLSYGVSAGQLAILDEGVLLTSQAQSINFTGANVQATASGNNVTVNIQNNFISVTYAKLSTLISNNQIIPNQDYEITDAEFGSTPVIPTKVYVQGITTSSVSVAGNGIFYNADYQTAGNYSGIVGFNAQLGLWDQTLAPVQNDVVIWNNFHYLNLTGANGVNNPANDLVNWQVLPLSATNGYIVEVDKVEYNQFNNQIMSRRDRRFNYVERIVTKKQNSLNFFKWGDNLVTFNNVEKFSLFHICNCKVLTRLSYNSCINSGVTIEKNTGFMIINVYEANFLKDMLFDSHNNLTFFQRNFIEDSQLVVDAVTFRDNQIKTTALTLSQSQGLFDRNVFSDATVNIQGNTSNITSNIIQTGVLRVLSDNLGEIKGNLIQSSGELNVTTNALGAVINYNVVNQRSVLEATTNNSSILNNQVTGQSRLDVVTNNDFIGDTNPAQDGGNYIDGHSTVNITLNNSFFGGNRLQDYTSVTVGENNNSIIGVEAYSSKLILVTNTQGVNDVVLKDSAINLGTPAYAIQNGVAVTGTGSIPYTLDCSDPTIYDAGTSTLTIPSAIADFAGVLTLTNAGGIAIDKVANLSRRWLTTFLNDAGTTTFNTTAVGLAVPTDVISSFAPLTALPIVYRVDGQDSILFRLAGSLAAVEQVNIYQ